MGSRVPSLRVTLLWLSPLHPGVSVERWIVDIREPVKEVYVLHLILGLSSSDSVPVHSTTFPFCYFYDIYLEAYIEVGGFSRRHPSVVPSFNWDRSPRPSVISPCAPHWTSRSGRFPSLILNRGTQVPEESFSTDELKNYGKRTKSLQSWLIEFCLFFVVTRPVCHFKHWRRVWSQPHHFYRTLVLRNDVNSKGPFPHPRVVLLSVEGNRRPEVCSDLGVFDRWVVYREVGLTPTKTLSHGRYFLVSVFWRSFFFYPLLTLGPNPFRRKIFYHRTY